MPCDPAAAWSMRTRTTCFAATTQRRGTRSRKASKMEKVFCKDIIPSGNAMIFMNKVKQATADPSPRATAQCPEAWDTGEAQDRLCTMAILRGCNAITISNGTMP